MTHKDFLAWEAASRDVIVTKRVYCDMVGDLAAGIMLSQIVYWHLPGKGGGSEHTKLRVKRGRDWWLAKNRAQWWDEVRLSPREADRALSILRRRKLVVVVNSMFAGKRTPFIRINWPVF